MFFSCFFSFSYDVWALMKKYSGRQLAQFEYNNVDKFCQRLMEKRSPLGRGLRSGNTSSL